jgi:putative transposase
VAISLVRNKRESFPRLGTKKLHHILSQPLKEVKIGRDKLHEIIKANGMLVPPLRQYKITTNSKHHFPKYKDLVTGTKISRPEQVWVSDITYISGKDKYYYLSMITDDYSKKIMGYCIDENMNVELVIKALAMAFKNRQYHTKLTHHSDRGSQYCCEEYQKKLRRMSVVTSMTENSDPYTNAIAERVNGTIKHEFLIDGRHHSLIELKLLITQAINAYNQVRPHLSCYMLTPDTMHNQRQLQRMEYRNKFLSKKINV